MNWIDEEADTYRAKKELEEKKQDLILRSEYWADVRSQIEKDVDRINNHPVWKQALCSILIELKRVNHITEISKHRYPEVTISVENKHEAIEVITTIKKDENSQRKPITELLTVESDGEKVYLHSNEGILHIPKEASKHILMPIIRALNKTL